MDLRPFDEIDWNVFSGCESKTPLIARHDTDRGSMTVIVDNEIAEANYMDASGFLSDTTVTAEFPTSGHTILFTLELTGNETPKEFKEKALHFGGDVMIHVESLQAGRV